LDLYLDLINKTGRKTEIYTRKWKINLSAAAQRGLRQLKQKKNQIVMRPSDKTNLTVLVDRKTYVSSIKDEIFADKDSFQILDFSRNAPKGHRGILNKKYEELKQILQDEYNRGNLSYDEAASLLPYNYRFGTVYGDVKTQKMTNFDIPLQEKIPFQLVFSTKGTLIEKSDKFVEKLITPLIKKDDTFLLDTADWIEAVEKCDTDNSPFDPDKTTIFV
jgi:hypothetical protein